MNTYWVVVLWDKMTDKSLSNSTEYAQTNNSTQIHAIEYNEKIITRFSICSYYKFQCAKIEIKIKMLGFPWWRSGWESACQCRGHGFEPWSGKITHAAERLGPWATIAEPARLERVLRNKRGRDSERLAHRDEEWPPLAATRESPRTETKTQHSHK